MSGELSCLLGLVILMGGFLIGAASVVILAWWLGRRSMKKKVGTDPGARIEWLLEEVEKERILQDMSLMFWDGSDMDS